MADHELYRFNPWNPTGVPIWYNWMGANECMFDGLHNKKSSPSVTSQLFHKIPDEKFKTPRPDVFNGKNEGPDYGWMSVKDGQDKTQGSWKNHDGTQSTDRTKGDLAMSGAWSLDNLFNNMADASGSPKSWGFCWHGYYSSYKWHQYYNAYFMNTTQTVYPFATKGISCRIKVPEGGKKKTEYTYIRSTDDGGEDYGDHQMIDTVWGLWMDLEGFYYIYELLPYGDNALKNWSSKGTSGRNYRNVWTSEGDPAHEIYPDGNIFNRQDGPFIGTSPWLQEIRPVLKNGQEKGLMMWSNEPNIENLFLVGINIRVHHDKKAGGAKPHTLMMSRVTPIPFHAPRHEPRTSVILGEPTPLEMLKKGYRKIHFWDGIDPTTGERGEDTLADYVEPPYSEKEPDEEEPVVEG